MNNDIEISDWKQRTRHSSIWAAYADALGFISEFASENELRKRTASTEVKYPVQWIKRIGGRFGVSITLPKGCYSDDTQQRLAVSRAISSDGNFDAEAFALLELAVWLCYKLGSGLASKVAATNLTRGSVSWNTNFYKSDRMRYTQAGGNGAAMRIQPHIWSLPANKSEVELLKNIIHDTVITHGHPRAIMGAAFHGLCLAYAMKNGAIPEFGEWKSILDKLMEVPHIISKDENLNYLWLPVWKNEVRTSFEDVWCNTMNEIRGDVTRAQTIRNLGSLEGYRQAVQLLGGFEPSQRGSGTKTALLSSLLAIEYAGDAERGVLTAANALGSDTDTIGTLAGALLGAVSHKLPEHPVQDLEYLQKEADRNALVRYGLTDEYFFYPDLMKWKPPESFSDGLYQNNGQLIVTGLGPASMIGDQNIPSEWQWVKLNFGQTILIKRRETIRQGEVAHGYYTRRSRSQLLNLPYRPHSPDVEAPTNSLSIDEAFEQILRSNFDPELIGKTLLKLTESENGVDKAIAFAALVSKAKRARLRKDNNSRT